MRVEFTGPGGVRGAERLTRLEKDLGGWEAGWSRGWRRGPSRTSGIGCSLKSRLPGPLSPQVPPTTPGARLGSGEGDQAGERGRERGEARARAPLAAGARPARTRRSRRHLFPLRLSVCRWLCPSAALPFGSPPPARPLAALRLPGPSPGEPRPGRPKLRPGAHCPAVRLSGGGAQGPGARRSAKAPGKKTPDSFPPGPG